MNTKCLVLIYFLTTGLLISACGPGQILEPTITPTTINTPTKTATPIPPTSTPTPIPPTVTALPDLPPPIPGLTLFLIDDFSNRQSGWVEKKISSNPTSMLTDTKEYWEDRFRIMVLQKGLVSWSKKNLSLTDFAFKVDITYEEMPADLIKEQPENQLMNFHGILFRLQDKDNFYLYGINGLQQFIAGTLDSGKWEPFDVGETFKDIGNSKQIKLGEATNTIMIVAMGSKLSFYANDFLLTEITDNTFSSGDIALMAYANAGMGWVFFDNAKLWIKK